MKVLFLGVTVLGFGLGILAHAHGAAVAPVATDQKRPDLTAIFTNGNYQQWIDQFGTVSRTALDASGRRIGTQVGHAGGPNGIVVEMTYLEPDAEHPLGQAFDRAGNPMSLHTGPQAQSYNPAGNSTCSARPFACRTETSAISRPSVMPGRFSPIATGPSSTRSPLRGVERKLAANEAASLDVP